MVHTSIVLCIQYIPINGKVESKLNFLYTIYRVKKENKILYIVVRARKKIRRRRAACQIFSSKPAGKIWQLQKLKTLRNPAIIYI